MLPEATPAARSGPGSGPRRERKKRQTREALIHTALELFDAQGYENTAVREITDAVDVSERTFFRYFASKEDLALSFVRDGHEALIAALADRPAEEEPLTALRHAMRDSIERFGPDDCAGSTAGTGGAGGELAYLKVTRLIDRTPSLLAVNLRYLHDHDGELIEVLARREGVDPDTDPRPRVMSAVFGALIFVATRDWRTKETGSAEEMLAAFDAYADQLGPALAGHWR